MIKLFATAAVGFAMLSGTAQADVSHCGINDSRMNPTELSAYQECWLDEYRNDDHGVLGSLFWVHVGGEYYSTQLKNLRTQSGIDMFLAGIEADVDVAVQERIETADNTAAMIELSMYSDLVEDHIEALEEIEDLTIERDALQVALDTLGGTNATLEGKIADLESKLNWNRNKVSALTAELADVENKLQWNRDKVKKLEQDLANGQEYWNAVHDELRAQIVSLETQLEAALVADTYSVTIKGNTYNVDSVADLEAAINAEKGKSYKKGFSAGVASVTITDLVEESEGYNPTPNVTNTQDDSVVTFNGVDDGGFTVSWDQNQDGVVNSLDILIGSNANNDGFQLSDITTAWKKSLVDDMKELIATAYDQGYDEGYADGYANGYAKGYTDGLASK